jgi:ABC-type uncharacterized transport system auxiliary subunit
MMRHTLLVLILAGLGACTGMLQSRQPASVTYILRPALTTTTAPRSETALEAVQVLDVVASPGFDTDAIILTDLASRKLDVFAASRWPERLPRMLETHIQDALRARGIPLVHDAAAPFPARHTLRVTVRRFDAEYRTSGSVPVCRVAFDVVVAERDSRRVLAAFSVEQAVNAEANRMGPVIAALEKASSAALGTLADGVVGAVQGTR